MQRKLGSRRSAAGDGTFGESAIGTVAMGQAAQIPGDLLWAYVEGRLEARTCSAIERYLARHPSLAREVRHMRQHQEILETADPRVLDEPVPERLTAVIRRARRRLLARSGSDRGRDADSGEGA